MLAVDGVLARGMAVELDKLVGCVSNGHGIALRIVDLDGVAVVDLVGHVLVVHDPQIRRTEFRSEFRQRRRRGRCDIDRRLTMTVCRERKVRVELTPELRALFAFVGSVGRVGRRRRETRIDSRSREFAILCPNQRTQERHSRQHDRARNRLLHDMPPFTNLQRLTR